MSKDTQLDAEMLALMEQGLLDHRIETTLQKTHDDAIRRGRTIGRRRDKWLANGTLDAKFNKHGERNIKAASERKPKEKGAERTLPATRASEVQRLLAQCARVLKPEIIEALMEIAVELDLLRERSSDLETKNQTLQDANANLIKVNASLVGTKDNQEARIQSLGEQITTLRRLVEQKKVAEQQPTFEP